jgi:hypothetical protein
MQTSKSVQACVIEEMLGKLEIVYHKARDNILG